MDDMYGNTDVLKNLFLGTIWSGVGAVSETAKLGYSYASNPQNRENISQNAKQFSQNFGKYTSNGREWLLSDPAFGASKYRQNAEIQRMQLPDAKSQRDPTSGRWNVRNETGFDDERENAIDDRSRSQSQNSAALNREQRSNEMETSKPRTNIYSSRPSDYSPNQKLLSDYENYKQRSQAQMLDSRLQSGDRRYATEANANVARQNNQLQSSDRRYGTDVNAGTQRYGIDVNAGVNRELGYAKTYAELQASLNRNQLNSGDNRYETATKYGTQERINVYNRGTVDQTDLAKAMVQAGTYGRSQSEVNAMNTDKYNRQVAADYDSKMMNYAKYQNEISNMNRSIGNSERAYSDQRMDMQNARAAATARYNQEQAQMRADKDYERIERARDRDQMMQERSNAINRSNQYQQQQNVFRQQELSFRQQQINSDVEYNRARTTQLLSDTRLRVDQFGAGRSDISYNRSNQAFSYAF